MAASQQELKNIENIIQTKGFPFLTQGQKDIFNAGQAPTPTVTPTPPIEAISSDLVEDRPTINVTDIQDAPPLDISGLETDVREIKTEEKVVETPFSSKLEDIFKSLEESKTLGAERAEFEAKKREEIGISATQTAEEDLVAQIKGFQIQSKAIENERALAFERIQQESLVRGRTEGGIRPLTAAAQRRLTLRQADITSQALTASAALNAVQGKLVTSQRLIAEAVEKEFGARIAEREAQFENADLLIKSGVLDREEKRRAEAVKAKAAKEKAEIEEEQRIKREALALAIKLTPQLATHPNAASEIDQLFKAGSAEEVVRIAASFGAFEVEAPTEAERLKTELLRTQLAKANLELTKVQKAANDVTPPGVLEALSDDQRSAYFKLVDKYEAESNDFFKVRDAFNRVVTSAENPSAAGDLALIFNFMKTLDPGSVVRESEFATAAQAGSFLDRTYGFGLKLTAGQRLSPDQRADFLSRSTSLFNTALEQQQILNNTFEDRAAKFGIPGGNVTRAIESVKTESSVEGVTQSEEAEVDALLEDRPLTEDELEEFFN